MSSRSLLFLVLSLFALAVQAADTPAGPETAEAAAAKAGVSIDDVRTFTAVYNRSTTSSSRPMSTTSATSA